MKLTKSAARKLAISAQALSKPVASALEAIEHLGYVQIDTISVIERAHHHVLWSRVPDFKPVTAYSYPLGLLGVTPVEVASADRHFQRARKACGNLTIHP